MLLFLIATAPLVVRGLRKVAEFLPHGWAYLLRFSYYPALIGGLVIAVMILYRVGLPAALPSHRLIFGSALAAVVFVVTTVGLRIYLTWITSTGYTYGALATPIAFLLFAFFGGFAIMLGAESNAAIQEEWPAPTTHVSRLRRWLKSRTQAHRDVCIVTDDTADEDGSRYRSGGRLSSA